jgi:hypothetical protein
VKAHLPCTDCGSKDALADYDTHTYCFSCSTRRKNSKIQHDLSKYLGTIEPVKREPGSEGLPRSMTKQLSASAKKWLLRYNLSEDTLAKHKVGHVQCEIVNLPGTGIKVLLEDRLILPVFVDGVLACYQARALDPKEGVKYLTVGPKTPFFANKEGHKALVIVEDIVSAMKVAQVQPGIDVVSLLGTSITPEFMLTLVKSYPTIGIWLDPDGPGQRAANVIRKKIKLYAQQVVLLKSKEDPKCLFSADIKSILQPLF